MPIFETFSFTDICMEYGQATSKLFTPYIQTFVNLRDICMEDKAKVYIVLPIQMPIDNYTSSLYDDTELCTNEYQNTRIRFLSPMEIKI